METRLTVTVSCKVDNSPISTVEQSFKYGHNRFGLDNTYNSQVRLANEERVPNTLKVVSLGNYHHGNQPLPTIMVSQTIDVTAQYDGDKPTNWLSQIQANITTMGLANCLSSWDIKVETVIEK